MNLEQLVGDPEAKLMQPELIERVREMADHFRDTTKMGKGGKR